MNSEERILELERRVSEMHAAYTQATDLMQHLGGSERVFQAAMLTMIANFPDKDKLRPMLLEFVERATTAVLFGAESESHQQGAQDARTLIIEFLERS